MGNVARPFRAKWDQWAPQFERLMHTRAPELSKGRRRGVYRPSKPVSDRLMTRRWISLVPSNSV